ncbi:MAG: electron transfer flavoprotein subunit alpha/FixB family protein [Nitrososphaerota archaeon]|nr:electron transfer flavoprotein subunit alpha/FixB family protein [Nitrososphaerota archaeon]
MNQTEEYRDVWVYTATEKDGLPKNSQEVIAAGRIVADKLGQKLVAVMLGPSLGSSPREAIEFGADRVLAIENEDLEDMLNLKYVDLLHRLAVERRPYAFLFVADELGKDIAPRLAYRLKTGLATDNIELDVGSFTNPRANETYKDLVIQIRPDFGTRVAKIFTPKNRPQMATIRPGNFKPLTRDSSRKGEIEQLRLQVNDDYGARVTALAEMPPPKVDLRGANVVISLGLGILKDGKGQPRDPRTALQMAEELKREIERRYGIKAEIGVSRALLYAELKELEGLISVENQVGQTGATVSPDVYIALGISGAVQHVVGMRRSKKIVAVNTDPRAPIFQIAHYPIVGDLYEVLPEILERVRSIGRKN